MKLQRLCEITTFEESIEASKYISRGIYEGILDDFGAVAEVEPFAVARDKDDEIVGVHFYIRAPSEAWKGVIEGVLPCGEFTRELTIPGSKVRILRPVSESYECGPIVERKFALEAS